MKAVRTRTLAFAAAANLLASGCGYVFTEFRFDRDAALAAGDVAGQAVRKDLDGQPAPFAQVSAIGAGLVRRADGEGRFSFQGLAPGAWAFQVRDDEDGDGWPERTAVVSARVRAGPKASGIIGEGPVETAGVLLGPVATDDVVSVEGRVLIETPSGRRPPSELGLLARVLVTRDLDLPSGVDDVFNTVSLGAEAQTAADATGTFVFSGVGTGAFQAVAFLFEDTADPLRPGRLVGAAPPLPLRGFAGDALDVSETPLVLVAEGPLEGRRTVQVGLAPEPEGSVYLVYVPQGREAPPCEQSPPASYEGTPFPWARRSGLLPGAADLIVEVPYGVYDVYVCTDEGIDGPRGTLFELTVPAPSGDPLAAFPVVVGPVLLSAEDPCAGPFGRDCDGDGRRGLEPFSPSSEADWRACVTACEGAFGQAAGGAACEVGGVVYDCDDDGDGQPDVTEDPACYGLGRGTDLDGDGLCSGQDPFPQCRANTAAECIAGEDDFSPRVPEAFGGEGDELVDSADDAAPT